MKKALIVDVTSLNKKGVLVAHMPNVAINYYEVLNRRYDALIAGGEPYLNRFGKEKVYLLPYDFDETKKTGKLDKLINKIHEIINAYVAINSRTDIIIFQCYSRLFPILFASFLFKKRGQKIFIIQYHSVSRIGKLGKQVENFLVRLCKTRIDGILCPNNKVGDRFPYPYQIVPDYFYLEDVAKFDKKQINDFQYKYDYGMFGIMGQDKNVESVINAFSNSKAKVIIAGKFWDNNRYAKCDNACTSNIVLQNRFLSNEEYTKYFEESRVILLPYEKGYDTHSSGVVLDALFQLKPILGTKVSALDFVKEYRLGELYETEEEMVEAIVRLENNYGHYVENIIHYLRSHETAMRQMYEFLEK